MDSIASLFQGLSRRTTAPARTTLRRRAARRGLGGEWLERRLALAATPTASVDAPNGFVGSEIPLTVTFDNTGTDIGYGPFVDVIMPAAGDAPPLPENGIAFKPGSASYLGIPLTPTVLTLGPTGQVNHPFAKDALGNPVVISGDPGDQLVVFQLPFGSYGPDQPPAEINFTGTISNLAQPSNQYDITATGGFQYQVDGSGNPTVNIAEFGAPATDPVDPELFVIEKDSSAPEDETATGPNFQHTYTVTVSVAPGQTLTNFTLTDVLPNNVQFVAVTSAAANGGTVISSSTPSTTVPGGTLAYEFDQVVGTGGADITLTYTFFMPEYAAGGADVIPLESGGSATATNTVGGSATWTSPNPNFPTPQFVVGDPVSYTVTGKTLALQKSASPFLNAKAGDTVTYTLSFQLSDYFALGGFVIDDLLSDGQDFDASFTPQLSFRQQGQSFTAQPFDPANYSVVVDNVGGTTAIDFDVAAQLAALGLATGTDILGAGIPAGGTGGPDPNPLPGGPGTTGTITFQAVIRNTYRATGDEVVQGDVVNNTATTGGTVLDFSNLAPTASTFSDGSTATVTLATGQIEKAVHAVNGSPVAGIPVVTAGDSVTFRITYALPFSSIGQYVLTDYLPLPIFEAGPLTYAGGGPSSTLPGVGQWSFGPLDTFFGISGIVPTTSSDAAANAVSWNFGTFQDSLDRSAVTDIFFTVAATNRPFADGLLLTNQAEQTEVTTDGRTLSATDIAQVRIAEPLLGITKGVVSTDNPAGVFTPSPVAPAGVTFAAPGQSGAAFTGTITSGGLAATPIDAALSNVLGNDLVKFTIIVENTGSGPDGAFNVTFQDTFDATKFRIPAGSPGLNLRITDGAGTPLAYTGDLFGAGIRLVDGATTGALAPGKTTAGVPIQTGRNIAVISYDLELLDTVVPLDVIPNTATLDRYTSTPDPSSPNFVPPGGISDTTTVTVMAPEAVKKLIDTSIIDATNSRTQAVVGELATFELTIRVPDGTTPDAVVVDALPAGLAFVQMVGSPVVDPGVSFTGSATPVVTNNGRTLTFNLGDIVNANPDRQLHGITVRYQTVVLNVATNVSNVALRNSATLSWDAGNKSLPAAQSDSPVIVIEPKLRLRKTPDVRSVEAGDVVTWTLVVSHANNSQTDAFNVSLTDVIPAGLTYVPGSLANTAGVVPTSLTPAGSTFTVTYDELLFDESSTLTFQTTVDADVVAGDSIVNRARTTWTSLPGDPGQITPNNPNAYERTGDPADPGQLNNYSTTASGTITVAQPEVAKSLVTTSIVNASNSATQAVIGETAIYTVTLTVPQGSMPAATLVDALPAGMAFVEMVGSPVVDPAITFTGSLVPVVAGGGQTITFNLGDVVNSDTDSTQPETIQVSFRAVVLNVGGNVAGTQLVNRSRATWNAGADATPFTSSGPVTVIEPELRTTKTVAVGGFGGNAGDPVTYTITIQQAAASDTDAFDVTFLDQLPAKIASPNLVSVIDTAGIVTAADFSLTGSTLTGGGFDLPKLPAGRTITLTVTGTLAAPLSAAETIVNNATTRWTSLQGDPGQITPNNPNAYERTGGGSADPGQLNDYVATGSVTITPNSADLAVVKTVNDATPNIGDTITFTITLSNLGPNVAHGVEVTDQLPAGLQFVSATPSQGSFDDGTGIWDVGTVALGAPAAQTLTIQALVLAPTTPGAIPAAQTNVATVTAADEPDPNPGNNTGTSTVTPLYADLGVKKTTSNVQPNVGDTFTYTVQLFNLGPAPSTNVTVTDTLPANVAFVSATPAAGTTFTPAATGGDWTVPVIQPGQTLVLTLTVQATAPGVSFNTVTITGSDVYDPNDRNDTARTPTDPQEADLVVSKTIDNARPQVGAEITFTVTLENLGPSSAQNVAVTDLLPAGLSYVGHTVTAGSYDDGTGVWTLGTVADQALETLTLTALVLSPGSGPAAPQTNTATATSTTPDPNPDNNTSESTETPLQADLAIFKTVDDPTPNVGQTIEFTINVANLGPDTATGVVVSDVLPAGLSFVSATPSQGSYSAGTGIWTVGTVTSADFPALVIRAVVAAPVSGPPAAITNTATVSGTEYDPDDGNNENDVTVTPQYADLAVTKVVDDAAPNVGDVVTFTITLENLGVDTATNVTLLDLLPAGLGFVSARPNQGSYDPGTGIWTVGTVDTLFARTLSVQATVLAPASGVPQPQTNTAAVATVDQYDPDPGNDEDEVTVTPQYADLAVAKTVDNDRPNVGDTITFTVTLQNLGIDAATGVTVGDALPEGLSFLSATPQAGTSYDPVTGIWTVGTLAPAATVTLLVEAEVVSGLPQTNTAAVTTADQFDPDPTNNTDSVTETPLSADLAIAKSVNDPAPVLGDTVTYTIVVSNAGPDSALNVIATELFPLTGLAGITAGTPSQGSYDALTGYWLVGNLPTGGSATITFTAVADAVGTFTNTATVSSTTFDPDLTNNESEATIEVRPSGVITGTEFGCDSGPLVRVVDPRDGTLRAEFYAYEPGFRGGVRVYGADITGDGIPEILTAPGPGRPGEVRVFDRNGTPLPQYNFFPFGPAYVGGVEVAAGSVTGPGRFEIVAGQSRGQSLVRVFTVTPGAGVAARATRQLQPFGPRYRGGVTVATADVGTFAGRNPVATTPDGISEIIVGSGAGIPAQVRAYNAVPRTPPLVGAFRTLGGSTRGVSVSKLPGAEGVADRVLVAGGPRSGGQVQTWRHNGSRFVRDAAFAAFGGTTSAVYAAALDAENIFTVEGIGGRTSGVRKNTAPSGGTASQVPQTSTFRPPLRVSVLSR